MGQHPYLFLLGLAVLCMTVVQAGIGPHIRVLIRTHHSHYELVQSLIWGMRYQGQEMNVTVDFVMIPTEPGSLVVLESFQKGLNTPRDVTVLPLDTPFFAQANVLAEPFRCTKRQRQRYLKEWGPETTVKYCDYDNHVYYQATDAGIKDAVENCATCTHILVTNSDNGYHPSFLERALKAGQDMVGVDFITQGQRVNVTLGVGGIDLGAVLFSTSIAAKIGGYTQALPSKPSPKDVHDADYWFVRKGLDIGGSLQFIRLVLFYHH